MFARLPVPRRPVPAVTPTCAPRCLSRKAAALGVLSASMSVMRVLRLCSVFEPRELTPAWVAYDPIGGMQKPRR